jgi:hypothetical protein
VVVVLVDVVVDDDVVGVVKFVVVVVRILALVKEIGLVVVRFAKMSSNDVVSFRAVDFSSNHAIVDVVTVVEVVFIVFSEVFGAIVVVVEAVGSSNQSSISLSSFGLGVVAKNPSRSASGSGVVAKISSSSSNKPAVVIKKLKSGTSVGDAVDPRISQKSGAAVV